jgi:hypothetical protein
MKVEFNVSFEMPDMDERNPIHDAIYAYFGNGENDLWHYFVSHLPNTFHEDLRNVQVTSVWINYDGKARWS